METTDVLERTLAQEKTRYDKFCRMMHVLSTLLCILFTAGAFFCLIVSTVQFIQYSNHNILYGSRALSVPGAWRNRSALEFRTSYFPPAKERRNPLLL